MHRLFTIHHLLDEICSYMSPNELSVLARVSSTWFQCAIPLLYRKVDSVKALEPLGEVEYISHSFITPPTDQDFKRFSKYAPYVRELSRTIPTPALMEAGRMCVSRDVAHLFPNIRSINLLFFSPYTFSADNSDFRELGDFLLSPSIEQFCLYIGDLDTHQYLCRLAITRFSALRSFEVHYSRGIGESAFPSTEELVTFFAHTLTSVLIPLFFDTPHIVECLSKMPNLCNLRIIYNPSTSKLKSIEKSIEKDEARGGFTSLLSFSFDGPLQPLYDIFLKPYNFTSLQTFSWNVDIIPSPDDVGALISALVLTCPHLKILSLGSLKYSEEPWTIVPWTLIQPISRCKELIGLSLMRMYISVSLEELTEFLKSRTTWTCLDIFTSDPLCLHNMLLYAEHCPRLERLGIFVDDRLESFVQDLPHVIPTFHHLTQIDFANSHILKCNTDHVVEFLYRVCKNPPYIFHSPTSSGQIRIGNVLKRLATLYVERESRTGKPMSSALKTFVKECMAEPEYEDSEDEDEDEDSEDEDEDEDSEDEDEDEAV